MVLLARHSVTRIATWTAAPFSKLVLMGEVKAHTSEQIFVL